MSWVVVLATLIMHYSVIFCKGRQRHFNKMALTRITSVPNLWLSSLNLWLLKSFNPTIHCGSLIHLTVVDATERSQLNHKDLRMNTLFLSLKVTQLASFSGNNYSFNLKF